MDDDDKPKSDGDQGPPQWLDTRGPFFECPLTNDEVEQVSEAAEIKLSTPQQEALQQAVDRFQRCRDGKHFPQCSTKARKREGAANTFEMAARAIEGVVLTDVDTGQSYAAGPCDNTNLWQLKKDLKTIAPRFKRTKAVVKAVVLLTTVTTKPADTTKVTVRECLDILFDLRHQERELLRHEQPARGLAPTLRWIARALRQVDAAESSAHYAHLSGEWPRRELIRSLHSIYQSAGGAGKGIWRHAGKTYRGRFFSMVEMTLKLANVAPTENEALGLAIKRALRS